MKSKLFSRMIEIWNMPPADRPVPDRGFEYYLNNRVEPNEVLSRLREEFSEKVIKDNFRLLLDSVVKAYQQGSIPNVRTRFLVSCCLALVRSESWDDLPASHVMNIVGSFDSGYYHRELRDLISKFLTDIQLLEALHDGMKTSHHRDVILSSLEGLRLYQGLTRKAQNQEDFLTLVKEVSQTLDGLSQYPDRLVQERAKRAKGWLKSLSLR